MAPSKKRGRSSSAQEWNVGDLVLAKVKGFTAWPAQVSTPEDFGHTYQPTRVFVCFFGTQQVRFCHHSEISRFTPEARANLVAKANSKCSPADLRLAVSQICEAEKSSRPAGDALLLNGRAKLEFNVIEDEGGPLNSEDGAVSEPEVELPVESCQSLEQGEAGNGAGSEVEDAELGWGSPDSSTSADVEEEPTSSSARGIEIPEKVQTNFASHEELDSFDGFDFYNEEVVNVPEKKKAPRARNGAKQRTSKNKKVFTPVIPVNICRRKRKQVTVKASLPHPALKEENTDEEHETPGSSEAMPEFVFRRKVSLTKRARDSETKVEEASSLSPVTHDPDSNLPIVKRARARSSEAMFRVESLENSIASPSDAPEPGKGLEDEGLGVIKAVGGSLPPKAEKYRIRSSLADSEAVLPPSKRRFRAFEAMSACAAEAAAEEQEQATNGGKDGEELVEEPEDSKACVAEEELEKVEEVASVVVDKEVDPVSVNVPQVPEAASPAPETPTPERPQMPEVSPPDAKEEDESPGVTMEKEALSDPVQVEETLSPGEGSLEHVAQGEAAQEDADAPKAENVEDRRSVSPEPSPVSMDLSEGNSDDRADRVGAEGQSECIAEVQEPGASETQAAVSDTVINNEAEAEALNNEAQASATVGDPAAGVTGEKAGVSEAQAQAPGVSEAQAQAPAPVAAGGVFACGQDSLVQMELRPSLYKFRRRGSRPNKEQEEKKLVSTSDTAFVRREILTEDFSRGRSGSPKASPKYSPHHPVKRSPIEPTARITPKLSPVSLKVFKMEPKGEELPSPGLKKGKSSRKKKYSPGSKNGSFGSEKGTTESHSGESLASEVHSGRIKAEITSSRTKTLHLEARVGGDGSLATLKHTEVEVNKVREAYQAAKELKQKLASKEGDTSSSMKYIMAACQSKQVMFEDGDGGGKELVLLGPGDTVSTDAEAAREAFKGLLDGLSRARESILRATRQAIDCAKLGLSEQVIDIIAKRLEMEQSYPRRIDLFFLVDSITQSSHTLKGTPAGVYRSIVQNALPRLLSAAAPPGSFARENRRQCLKVFKLWHERGVFPPPVIRHFMHEIELHNCERMMMNMSRRPARNERPVDDPIREMEGMQVDEYGSNASFALPGLNIPRMFEDEEEANEAGNAEPGEVLPAPSATPPPEPVDRHRRVLEDVDGELEMEDVSPENESWQRQYVSPSSILSGPPLPVCPPPSPPPLPASPPPPPPPPPPPHCSSPPPPPGYSFHEGFQDGYGYPQPEGYFQEGGSPPGGYHVQNTSSFQPQGYDQYYEGGEVGGGGYSSYGYPEQGAGSPQYGGGAQQQHQFGYNHHHQQHHHQQQQQEESEYYGAPPPGQEAWSSEASSPPRGRYPQQQQHSNAHEHHGNAHGSEYYNEASYHDRYAEHGGGGEYYHGHGHHHHHQNGPPAAPPPPPYNGTANHYDGGYSSSGRYQSPERHSRRRHYSHEGYEYGHESYGGSRHGGGHEYGRDGYHHLHESGYSSHGSYSRWG